MYPNNCHRMFSHPAAAGADPGAHFAVVWHKLLSPCHGEPHAGHLTRIIIGSIGTCSHRNPKHSLAAVVSRTPPTSVPAAPAPLTLEQQHITAVEGIVLTSQNIVATVNLDCRLDLKMEGNRNAEYNPKVGILFLFHVNVGLLSFAIT